MNLEQFKKRMQPRRKVGAPTKASGKILPDTPGVYFFLDKTKKVLYIGKATDLRSRVRSYFSKDLHKTRGPIITDMVAKARSIDWRETDSVLEALILEANLIKSYKPAHNTDLKDDKSWNYVVVTKEDFPRVLLVRGKELVSQIPLKGRDERDPNSLLGDFGEPSSGPVEQKSFRRSRAPVHLSGEKNFATPAHTFGPFPHGLQLKEALRIIRKIFPYRDTCVPAPEMLALGKAPKACFNAGLGLCPGVCSGAINKTEYRKIVRRIVMLFQGKKVQLLKSLERDMKKLAKAERFEEASMLKRQVFALQHIQDISLIKDEYRMPASTLGINQRIEAYDVAHLAGSAAVGVMTVVENGTPLKAEYRKFTLRNTKAGDDAGGLREILSRRLGHEEWPMPRIIVVDGSTAQLNAAEKVLKEYGIRIPVLGVTKDAKHRPRAIQGDRALITGREHDIMLANTEAHRFAIGFHRKRRSREMGL